MLYREAGQFKATYAEDSQIFPIRQDRIGFWVLMLVFGSGCALAALAGAVLLPLALGGSVTELAQTMGVAAVRAVM